MLLNGLITPNSIVMGIATIASTAYIIYWFYLYFQRRQAATFLKPEEFAATMRNAQVIDVREPNEYRSAHILGARNVSFTSTQQGGGLPGLNKSQPIYLYDNGVALAGRMAAKLKKAGYENIYILKGGFSAWEGKVKRGAE